MAVPVLIFEEVGCCAMKEAFYNEGISSEDNIFENSIRIVVNLKDLKDEALYEWLRIASEELFRLQGDFPEILFCGHARKDHESVLQKFIALIFIYLAQK